MCNTHRLHVASQRQRGYQPRLSTVQCAGLLTACAIGSTQQSSAVGIDISMLHVTACWLAQRLQRRLHKKNKCWKQWNDVAASRLPHFHPPTTTIDSHHCTNTPPAVCCTACLGVRLRVVRLPYSPFLANERMLYATARSANMTILNTSAATLMDTTPNRRSTALSTSLVLPVMLESLSAPLASCSRVLSAALSSPSSSSSSRSSSSSSSSSSCCVGLGGGA